MTRWCTRVALAAMALCMAAPAPAAERVDRREANFQVGALVPGLGNRYRTGRSFPVAVELSVLATPVAGTITVQTQTQAESIPVYTVPFDLSPGASYRYYLYPYCQNLSDSYTLTIRDSNGRELRQEPLTMKSHETGTYLVATIGHEDVAGLGPTQQNDQRIGLQSVPMQMDFMPPKCCGWDPTDAIIWPHPDPSGMSSAQQKAITDWVLGGGRLILAPGDSWQAVAKTFLSDFVPGTVTGLEVTPYLDKLGAFGGVPFDSDSRMSISVLKDPVGEVLVWSESRPLVVRYRAGFGEVIFLAFDPTKSPFARWRGSQAFWESILALKRPTPSSQQPNQPGNYFNPYGSYGVSDTLANSLGEFPKVKPISFTFVVIFLLIYVVLIGPVDYFVLKRLKHLEWTWFTFPAVALVATGTAFWTISSTRTARIYINQLAVMDWSADGRSERTHDVAVLLSPTNQRYDVTFKNAGGELFLMENHRDTYGGMRGGFNVSATTFPMDDVAQDGPVAKTILIPVWSTRTFCGRLRQNAKTNVPFSVALSVVGDHLEGTITSHALEIVQDIKVIHKTGVYSIGRLGPSETAKIAPKQRRKLLDFYNQSRGAAITVQQPDGGAPDRERAQGCAVFSTVAYDSRYFPAMYYGSESNPGDDERYSFGLPPEWSLRSSIEAGQAVIIGTASRCPSQLNIGPGNIERYEKTIYRVCAEAK
jgi:hypothetical protein